MCIAPVSGGKPVTEVPGERPMSPVITEGPVLVTVDAPNTANDPAVPKFTVDGGAADADRGMTTNTSTSTSTTAAMMAITTYVPAQMRPKPLRPIRSTDVTDALLRTYFSPEPTLVLIQIQHRSGAISLV